MSEFEQSQLALGLMNTGIELFTVYISIVSGYLVAAYFVGSNLTKSQVTIITSFFVLTALFISFAGFVTGAGAQEIERQVTGKRDILYWSTYLFLIVQLLGVIAAVKFMVDTRKRNGV